MEENHFPWAADLGRNVCAEVVICELIFLGKGKTGLVERAHPGIGVMGGDLKSEPFIGLPGISQIGLDNVACMLKSRMQLRLDKRFPIVLKFGNTISLDRRWVKSCLYARIFGGAAEGNFTEEIEKNRIDPAEVENPILGKLNVHIRRERIFLS